MTHAIRVSSRRSAQFVVEPKNFGRYDSSYSVTTHAPRGRVLNLRSAASTWTRANLATAPERMLGQVEHSTRMHPRSSSRFCEPLRTDARVALTSTLPSAQQPRSGSPEWSDAPLRNATSRLWEINRRLARHVASTCLSDSRATSCQTSGAFGRESIGASGRAYALRGASSHVTGHSLKVVGHIGHDLGARFSHSMIEVRRHAFPWGGSPAGTVRHLGEDCNGHRYIPATAD